MYFIDTFRSEWLKKKRSLASWLIIIGGIFTPVIILGARIKNHAAMPALYAEDGFWASSWYRSWESMEIFLLPVGISLATGLLAQIEFKNNTWKQLHTTPQWFTTIFFAKFLVILIMLVEVFVIFNVGFYLSCVVPSLIFADVPYPNAPFSALQFWNSNVNFFVDCLPVLALQYLLSLQFKNFLVPVGAGFAIWFLGLGLLSWEYSFLFPYNQGTIRFLIDSAQFHDRQVPVNVEHLALIYFAVIMCVGWFLYVTKKERS